MTPTPRRAVLTGVGAAVCACGMAACSKPETGVTALPQSSSEQTGTTTVEVPVADVPVGGGKILAEAQLVVTQPEADQFKAFSALCTHKGCPVSSIEGEEIVCNCHNSRFSTTDGAVITGPADSPLTAATVKKSGDKLIVTA